MRREERTQKEKKTAKVPNDSCVMVRYPCGKEMCTHLFNNITRCTYEGITPTITISANYLLSKNASLKVIKPVFLPGIYLNN